MSQWSISSALYTLIFIYIKIKIHLEICLTSIPVMILVFDITFLEFNAQFYFSTSA